MKSTTYSTETVFQLSATSTTQASHALPTQAAALLIGVETTDARITFDGTVPTSSNSLLFPKGNPPVMVLVGNGATITALANTAGTSLVTIQPLQG